MQLVIDIPDDWIPFIEVNRAVMGRAEYVRRLILDDICGPLVSREQLSPNAPDVAENHAPFPTHN